MPLSARPDGHVPVLSRREFLLVSAAGAAGLLAGCATDPVTGRRQIVLMSEADERKADSQSAPHQISADYGPLRQTAVNRYLTGVGESLAARSHRPAMPYTFRGVNAVYVNAYAFPGGTIAATRGLLASLESEAELAALLGHEIGHVCARHAAERATKGVLASLAVAGLAAAVPQKYEQYGDLAAGLGAVFSGGLLAHYSRENEREADALGLEYMTRAGYNPEGCMALMDRLRRMSNDKPGALELIFATHPMSEERYQTASEAVRSRYAAQARDLPMHRERYRDHMAPLYAIRDALDQMQRGEQALHDGRHTEAATAFQAALKKVPDDYAGLLLLARCRLLQQQAAEAERLALAAQAAYPGEPQAVFVTGTARLKTRSFDAAYRDFERYASLLPGNPSTLFYQGFCMEGAGRRQPAAEFYKQYLSAVQEGDNAEHAYRKLVEWGYVKP